MYVHLSFIPEFRCQLSAYFTDTQSSFAYNIWFFSHVFYISCLDLSCSCCYDMYRMISHTMTHHIYLHFLSFKSLGDLCHVLIIEYIIYDYFTLYSLYNFSVSIQTSTPQMSSASYRVLNLLLCRMSFISGCIWYSCISG